MLENKAFPRNRHLVLTVAKQEILYKAYGEKIV